MSWTPPWKKDGKNGKNGKGCPPHEIDPSDREKAKGGKGGTVVCKSCQKRLRLTPKGESIKDEVKSE